MSRWMSWCTKSKPRNAACETSENKPKSSVINSLKSNRLRDGYLEAPCMSWRTPGLGARRIFSAVWKTISSASFK